MSKHYKLIESLYVDVLIFFRKSICGCTKKLSTSAFDP